ncbi:MAG: hypothetical protein R3E90_07755 [Marinicella sp.]
MFRVKVRTAQRWLSGHDNKPYHPPQAIYNAIFNLNNSFMSLAHDVACDESNKYIMTYHDEYSLRDQFPDCLLGIQSHRAFVAMVLGFNPELRTVPEYIDYDDPNYVDPEWGTIINVAPEIDTSDLDNLVIFPK